MKRFFLFPTLVIASLLTAGLPTPVAAQNGANLGRPSAAALATARAKEDSMRRPRGPVSVTLSPHEMASLVDAGLDPQARRAIDSLGARLQPNRLTLHAYLVTSILGPELGPMAMLLDSMEPIWVSGPARVTAPGVIAWEPDSFKVRSYSLPPGSIPRLVNRLTGGTDGTIPIAVPPTVTRIRIDAGRVTFSRR